MNWQKNEKNRLLLIMKLNQENPATRHSLLDLLIYYWNSRCNVALTDEQIYKMKNGINPSTLDRDSRKVNGTGIKKERTLL